MCTPRLCPLTTSADMTCWRGSTTPCTSPTPRSSRCAQVRTVAALQAELLIQTLSSLTAAWSSSRSLCCRGGLLPVHGHVVSWLHPAEEGQVPGQAGARIHTQLQSSSGGFQTHERRQSQANFRHAFPSFFFCPLAVRREFG